MPAEFDLYRPRNNIMLDAYVVLHQNRYHLFYTQQPADIPFDYAMRKGNIGHAVSDDLLHWQECEPALNPGTEGRFDDRAVWIGCVYGFDNVFYMFYTAHSGSIGNFPNIGVAVSKDLYRWEKVDKPLFDVNNSKWYACSRDIPASGWRDPYVFQLADQPDIFYLVFAGKLGNEDYRQSAVIGLARSRNLVDWELLEPLYSPGIYEAMDVPHIIVTPAVNFLLFYVNENWILYDAKIKMSKWSRISGTRCIIDSSRLEFKRENDNYVIVGNSGTGNDVVPRTFVDKSGRLSSISYLFDRIGSDEGAEAGGRLSPPRLVTIGKAPDFRFHPIIAERTKSLEPYSENIWLVDNPIYRIEIRDNCKNDIKVIVKANNSIEQSGYLVRLDRRQAEFTVIRQCDSYIVNRRSLSAEQAACDSIQLVCWRDWLEIYLDDVLVTSSRVYHEDGNVVFVEQNKDIVVMLYYIDVDS